MDEKPSDEELLRKKIAELASLTAETTNLAMKVLGKKLAWLVEDAAKTFESASKMLDEAAKKLRKNLER